MKSNMTKYQVIDARTGNIMGVYINRTMARRKVDRLDNEYGGYRYFIKEVDK